ncbi:MAG: 4Fe-4S binding protein [Candidatus Bathyarchaeota archaeon]|nr:MAG: 4Fe-4S binding protein [Candidatus Bathyarchaeota archaeon]
MKINLIDNRCKECGFCIEFCPKDVLGFADKPNTKGYHPPIVKNQENCILCARCEFICPELAIFLCKPEEST